VPLIVYVYLLGFAGTMALVFVSLAPFRDHPEIQKNLLSWTIGALLVSALWPVALIAALVAATDR
jgi:hypothetical protein